MRKTKRTLPLTLAALLLPTAAFAATPIPLENAGFENGLTGWKAEKSEKMFAATPAAASLGQAGLRITDGEARGAGRLVSPGIPVTAGRIYELSFWGRMVSEKPGTNTFLEFHAADGKVLKGTPLPRSYAGASVKYGHAFIEYANKITAPEGAVTVNIVTETWGSGTCVVDIDDMRLLDVTDGVEPQPDLEALIAIARAAKKPLPKVIVKLDDLKQVKDRIYPRWQKVADFAKERKIKVGFGIVFESMEEDCPKYVAWIKQLHDTGLFEFWCHGFDHAEWKEGDKTLYEFGGSTYEHQKEHLTRCTKLCREKLGFPLVSFGAPFNIIDDTANKVLGEDPDIQVVMFADNVPGKVALPRVFSVNIESPTFVANYPAFVEGYVHNLTFPVFVCQGHPNSWDDNRYKNFTQIVDFLQSIGAEFAWASDYAPKKTG